MTPYAARLVHPYDQRLFEEVKRALAAVFPIEFEDGYFGRRGWCHSWLVTPNEWIIDPYPWACVGGPILVDASGHSPWKALYRPVKLEVTTTPEFERDRDFVTGLMREEIRRRPTAIFLC